MWVSGAEPGGHSAWIGASNDHNLNVVLVDFADEVSEIGQALLRAEVGQMVDAPIIEWLRVTVETMLEHEELSVILRSDHEWVKSGVWHSASVLTTDVEEDGALTIPILVADPVTLLVSARV